MYYYLGLEARQSENIYNDFNSNCIKEPGEDSITGFSVMAQPGNYFAVSDINGNYELNVKFGKARVTYSFVGYNSFEKTFFLSNGEIKTYNLSLVERMRKATSLFAACVVTLGS